MVGELCRRSGGPRGLRRLQEEQDMILPTKEEVQGSPEGDAGRV